MRWLLSSFLPLLIACSSSGTAPADPAGTAGSGGDTPGGSGGSAGQGASSGSSGQSGVSGSSGQAGAPAGGQAGAAQAGAGGEAGGEAGASGQGGTAGAGAGGAASCPRALGPADRDRRVIVSHPFLEGGGQGTSYRQLTLSKDGTLSADGPKFTMGRSTHGRIVFTPDGLYGFVVQDKGKIGVFSLEGEEPKVLHENYDAGTFASSLVMAPEGDRLYILNNQFRQYGGGLHVVRIGCDGTLTNEGQLAEGKLTSAMEMLPSNPTRAVVASADLLDSAAGLTGHLLTLSQPPALVGSVDAFGDDQALVSQLTLSHDEAFAFIADNGQFTAVPNRISVLSVLPDGLKKVQTIAPIEDPYDLVASPFDHHVLVVSGYGNALFSLAYDAASATPFTDEGPLTYVGKKPQLPGNLVMIRQGELKGRVLLGEISGVRQVQFPSAGGAATDIGLTKVGTGSSEDIPGAIGVQP